MREGWVKIERFEKIKALCGICGKEFESRFMKEEEEEFKKWESVKCFHFGPRFSGDIIFVCSPECFEKWTLDKLEQFKKEW